MITRIEAKNYRSLKYISQEVKPFQILIGPNASGKSTFLDVVAFVGDIVRFGVREAVEKRSRNFDDLTFNRMGGAIEITIEFRADWFIKGTLDIRKFDSGIGLDSKERRQGQLKYEIKLEIGENESLRINSENLFQVIKSNPDGKVDYKILLNRSDDQMISFFNDQGKPSLHGYTMDENRSGLSSLVEDNRIFGQHLWLRDFLTKGIRIVNLDGQTLKGASNPGQGIEYTSNGSNFPWVVSNLRDKHPELFDAWLSHLKSALPDILSINILPVPDLNQRYLDLEYANGSHIPSWLLSDGTLRFLALTLIAYLPNQGGIFLIEEPENGLHPKILEAVYQSLSSVYDTQILLATHSPLFLTIAGDKDLLLFTRGEDGSTLISNGVDHPYLKDWNRNIDLGTVFASGVLG